MDEHGIKIKLAYFGLNDPANFGIDYDYLPSYVVFNPKNVKETIELKGWFAISATMLQGVYLRDRNLYALFKEIQPVDTIGYRYSFTNSMKGREPDRERRRARLSFNFDARAFARI